MLVLGISAFYHDSAIAVVKNGQVLWAAQEERYSRIKHNAAFPARAISKALCDLQIDPSAFDAVVFYEKPLLKFDRIISTVFANVPFGFEFFSNVFHSWFGGKIFQKRLLRKELQRLGFHRRLQIKFSNHHLSHAASAFYPSPFEEAAVLTMDGVGEWATASIYRGHGQTLVPLEQQNYPHSLGLLYSAFTEFLGFKVNSGEYKLMGLAPYGRPVYVDLIERQIAQIDANGAVTLNMEFFVFNNKLRTINVKKFEELFGIHKLPYDSEKYLREHLDIAASIQAFTEMAVLRMASYAKCLTGSKNLCLAGGVALNCVANGILERSDIFDSIWIQPAAGDAGGSLGAALAFSFLDDSPVGTGQLRRAEMTHAYLGNEYCERRIEESLEDFELDGYAKRLAEDELVATVALALSENKIVGWFQGRMEFGPRALGNRSILANPLDESAQVKVNQAVKFREAFRPFAPVTTKEFAPIIFENFNNESPFMLKVYKVKSEILTQESLDIDFNVQRPDLLSWVKQRRSVLPAITHVDNSARVQSVSRDSNPLLYELLNQFGSKTGYPVLINTSFNVRGEPIVESPSDAIRCFLGTHIDILVMGNLVLTKEQLPAERSSVSDHHEKFVSID